MPVDVFCAAVSGRAGSFSPAGRIVMVSFVTIFQRKKWRGKRQRMRQFSHPGHVFLRRYESDQVRRHYLNCINRAVHLTLLLNYLHPQVMMRHRRIQQCRALQTRISTDMGQIHRVFRLPQIIPSLHSQPHRCIRPRNRLSQLQSHDGRNSNFPPKNAADRCGRSTNMRSKLPGAQTQTFQCIFQNLSRMRRVKHFCHQ